MNFKNSYVLKSFLWGSIAKLLDASIKFVSVPLLLNHYGKSNFGLISLAISINAYLGLLDMGINTGAVKYFSEWIHLKKNDLLDSVARTSITFYLIIGTINALVLLIIVFSGINIFSLSGSQKSVMSDLFIILAVFAIINWSTSVFNQLLTANEDIYYLQQINIYKSIVGIILIYAAIYFQLSLVTYFFVFTLVNSIVLVPFYIKAKTDGLIKNFLPAFDWINFKEVFKYSLAILAIGIFSFSATKLRPIILAIFAEGSADVVADYRIMETITIFVISIGGMFLSIFLPKTSKLLLENDKSKIDNFVYEYTSYTSIVCVVLCFPLILNSTEILVLYVGKSYTHLSNWLIIWLFTILFYLHNSPIASLILSTGKTKLLVFSSATSCIISLIVNAALCKYFEVGSAVIGYSLYILIHMSFYYFYFNKKILGLNSFKVFKLFVFPTTLGIVAILIVTIFNINFSNLIFQIIVKTTLWFLIFIFFIFFTNILNFSKLKKTLINLKQKQISR